MPCLCEDMYQNHSHVHIEKSISNVDGEKKRAGGGGGGGLTVVLGFLKHTSTNLRQIKNYAKVVCKMDDYCF